MFLTPGEPASVSRIHWFVAHRRVARILHPMRPSLVRRSTRAGVVAGVTLALACAASAAIDPPVSPNAHREVAALLRVLESVSERYILSGQQELGWDNARVDEDIAFIERETGQLPVVRGLDYGDYLRDPGAPARYHATERAIAWAKRGGIVTFSLHLPMDLGAPAGNPQFYTPGVHGNPGTTFDLRQAVIDGTPENRELIAKMDVVAAELMRLRDAGVVVIWRPFHECGGTWFWWSAHGPEPYRRLWRLMFDRYTRMHGLENLIWCYNPIDSEEIMRNWYPGDDVVDLIGFDVYPKPARLLGLVGQRHPTYAGDYQALRAFRNGRKVVALTENGQIPDPDRLFAEGAGWAYFLTWNQFIDNPAQNSLEFVRKVYAHPKVVTLAGYPALRDAMLRPNGADAPPGAD